MLQVLPENVSFCTNIWPYKIFQNIWWAQLLEPVQQDSGLSFFNTFPQLLTASICVCFLLETANTGRPGGWSFDPLTEKETVKHKEMKLERKRNERALFYIQLFGQVHLIKKKNADMLNIYCILPTVV